jgi:hypothetical protein
MLQMLRTSEVLGLFGCGTLGEGGGGDCTESRLVL